MLSLWPKKTLSINVLVKGFTKLSIKGIFLAIVSPFWTILWIKWYFLSMCLPFRWFLSSLDYTTIPLLSQNSIMDCTTKGIILSPMRNFLSQMTFFVAWSYNVLGFHSGVNYVRLHHTSPTNSYITKIKNKTRGRSKKILIRLQVWTCVPFKY